VAEWGNLLPYYQAAYDTLLLATTEGEIAPYLAPDYSYDHAETTLTLTIREGVTFSDVEPLDAEAVAVSMNRFKDGSGPDARYMAYVDEITALNDTPSKSPSPPRIPHSSTTSRAPRAWS